MATRTEDRSAHIQSRMPAFSQPDHPWSFPAICIMVLALTLLSYGVRWEALIQLLPGSVAAYLLIGACFSAQLYSPARPAGRGVLAARRPARPPGAAEPGFRGRRLAAWTTRWGSAAAPVDTGESAFCGAGAEFPGSARSWPGNFHLQCHLPISERGLVPAASHSAGPAGLPGAPGPAAAGRRRAAPGRGNGLDCLRDTDSGSGLELTGDTRRRRSNRRAYDHFLGPGLPRRSRRLQLNYGAIV